MRIKSILVQAAAKLDAPLVFANGFDKELAMKICEFPDIIDRAFDERAPNVLTQYIYDLAVVYNAFYHNCHVLSEPDAALKNSWLRLSAAVLEIFETFARIIKITIPERM